MSTETLTLYARCLINGELYRVDLNKIGDRYTLRPVDMAPYKFLLCTKEQLKNKDLFLLFPIYRTARPQARLVIHIPVNS